jgi:hypothetical protein
LTVIDKPAPFNLDLLTLSVLLEQEQSATLDVLVPRQVGFDGEIKLSIEGYGAARRALGPGLETTPVTAKAMDRQVSLQLRANRDAEIASRPIYVRGEATVAGHTIVQYSQPIPLSVRQLPFTLENTMKRLSVTIVPPGVPSAAGEAEFAIRASRRGWFTDQINLALEGLPEGIVATSTNLPNHVGEVPFKLTATEKAVPKEYRITVVGSASAGGRTYQQKTEPLVLTVAKPQDVPDKQ